MWPPAVTTAPLLRHRRTGIGRPDGFQ
jgi:hypothetical protein